MRSGTDVARNVEAMEKLVSDAVAKGAQYVQTPEMTGALMRDRAALLQVCAMKMKTLSSKPHRHLQKARHIPAYWFNGYCSR